MTRSKDVDPTGQFERAQAEVAGISHEAIPPKLDSIKPEAGGLESRTSVSLIRHGHTVDRTYSPTYHSWQAMLARCRYPARDLRQKHIGRGITVCDRWRSFDLFLEDMGERPDGTTLDRTDNDGNYEPGNCRWSTPTEQARNRRNARMDFPRAVEVALARLRGEPCKSIAERFGCSESLPREIANGRSWQDASNLARSIYRRQSNG